MCIVHGTCIGHEMVSLLPVKCHVGIHCHTHNALSHTRTMHCHKHNALSHTRTMHCHTHVQCTVTHTMHCHTHVQCTVTNTMHCHTHNALSHTRNYIVGVIHIWSFQNFLTVNCCLATREVLCKISCIPLVQMMAWIPHTGALRVIRHVLMIIN